MKERSGYVFKLKDKWIARVTFTDASGKRKSVKRSADTQSEAKASLNRLLRELEEHDYDLTAETASFDWLADYYAEHYLVEPVYVDERKIAGLRSVRDSRRHLETLREFFGKKKLKAITYGDLEQFKRARLSKPTHRGTKRSLADVHRTLTVLRTVLNVAVREGWIKQSPFSRGKALINMADERPRERTLSLSEERTILEDLRSTPKRENLLLMVLLALDTGMRRSESFLLCWEDVDLERRCIQVRAFNTKTMKARLVPVSSRLVEELQKRRAEESVGRIFPGNGSWLKGAIVRLRKRTGITNFRLHDCRHTAATRLVQGGLPLTEVARILGHTTLAMTYRYANADDGTLERAAAIMDNLQR